MPASAALDSARRELSSGRDSAAVEILQDWTEENLPTAEEEALLDSLQSLPSGAPSRRGVRLWRAGGDLVGRPSSRLPLLGMFDVSRRLVLLPGSGAQVFGGMEAGTWLDGRRTGAGIDAKADLLAGDSADLREVAVWAGWTNASEVELGFSNRLSFERRGDSWTVTHGPNLVASWRRTRIFGWDVDLEDEHWRISGALRWRQDPQWPDLADGTRHPMDLARAGFQSTTRVEYQIGGRPLVFGPSTDLDGRVMILPDRWGLDSLSPRSSSRRWGMQCNPAVWVKWTPTRGFLLRGELGWSWVFETGGAPLDLSPFLPGPYLRLSSAWRI